MRLLQCIPSFHAGGAERQCAMLCAELADRGHEVHVAYVMRGNSDYLTRLEESSAILHCLGEGLSEDIRRAQKDPRVLWRVRRLIGQVRPELVQSWNRPMDTFCGILSRLQSFPWILSERSAGLLYANRREALRVLLARSARAVVANSAAGREYWQTRARTSTRLYVAPNMVSHATIEEDSSAVAWPEGFDPSRTVLYVGRFSFEKNVVRMAEALQQVLGQRDAYAILCGSGDLLPEVRTHVEACNLQNRIAIMGQVNRPWQWMKRVAATISFSLCEGHPNVVTEAMVAQSPLVVSSIPSHTAFLDDGSAILVPCDSVGDMAAAIINVLDDPAAARKRAARAYEISQQWRPERVVALYESIYADMTGQRVDPVREEYATSTAREVA